MILHFVSIWLLAGVLAYLGLGHRALLTFAVLLLLPPYVEASAYVLSENLSEFCLAAGLASLLYALFGKRTSLLWISSFFFAYAALTRPTFQAATLALVGCLWITTYLRPSIALRSRDFKAASLILVLVPCGVVGAYSAMNYVKYGYFGSSAFSSGLNTRTVRFLERLPDRYATTREALIRARNSDLVEGTSHTGYQSTGRALTDLQVIAGIPESRIAGHLLKIDLLLIAKAPLSYLQEVGYAVSSYWFPRSTSLANLDSRFLQFGWAVVHFFVILCFGLQLIVLTGTELLLLSRRVFASSRPVALLEATRCQMLAYYLALTLVVYTMLVSCLVQTGDPRFRMPTEPLIMVLIFLGTHIWINSVRRLSPDVT
jgi:hypothetical protein